MAVCARCAACTATPAATPRLRLSKLFIAVPRTLYSKRGLEYTPRPEKCAASVLYITRLVSVLLLPPPPPVPRRRSREPPLEKYATMPARRRVDPPPPSPRTGGDDPPSTPLPRGGACSFLIKPDESRRERHPMPSSEQRRAMHSSR